MGFAFTHECDIKLSVWHAKEFGLPSMICYAENDYPDPRFGSRPGWYRIENGVPEKIEQPELTEYRGRQPLTWGFHWAVGVREILSEPRRCPIGRFVIQLEGRDFAWQKPAEIGTRIKTLNPWKKDRFPDNPFDVYVLDDNARRDYDAQRLKNLERYQKGVLDMAPDAYLHVSAVLDSVRCYVRDIPFTPVNEISEVKAVIEEQLYSLIRTDEGWLHSYLGHRTLRMDVRDVTRLCTEMSV